MIMMTNKRHKLLGLLVAATVLTIVVPAFAVLTSDSTNIGKHPSYSSSYSAFWRTNDDYAYLTDGSNIFINKGSGSSAYIGFRAANGCGGSSNCTTDPSGFSSLGYIDSNADLFMGGFVKTYTSFVQIGSATNNSFEGSLVITGTNSIIELVGASAQAYKPGGGSWSATSDVRTKKNESTYTAGLDALRQVRPVWYSYNGKGGTIDSDRRFVGVNAQDIEPVEPSMVNSLPGDLPGGVKHVDPSEFTYMLINAVQELDAKVKRLESNCRK
jgi:hypothetical protein